MQIVFTEFFDSSSHRRRSRRGTDLVQLAALSRIPLRCFAGGDWHRSYYLHPVSSVQKAPPLIS